MGWGIICEYLRRFFFAGFIFIFILILICILLDFHWHCIHFWAWIMDGFWFGWMDFFGMGWDWVWDAMHGI